MAHDVTIEAAASDGKQYLITFAKTGDDKGSVTLKPNDGKPSSYALYDIRAAADNSAIRCKADVTGPDPSITCSAMQEGQEYRLRVAIATFVGTWTNDYKIRPQDRDRLADFIENAGFPH
jgi:hypothetical protein